jgi:DNA polymerase beta
MDNAQIATELKKLADFYAASGEAWRSSAFYNAATIIKGLPTQLTSENMEVVLKGKRGIGSGVKDRIRRLLTVGYLEELKSEVKSESLEQLPIYQELIKVQGLGPVTVRKLMDMGVTGINDLAQKVDAKQISLTHAQLLGLRYYYHLQDRIPRAEIKKFGEWIVSVIKTLDPTAKAEIVGSYRRGKETSGDIDILMTGNPETFEKTIDFLSQAGFLQDKFSQGPVKYQGLYLSNYGSPGSPGIMRKIDIRYVSPESWATALLHATGSDRFNVQLRQQANALGLTLSEHSLSDMLGRVYPVTSEADVFKYLSVEYVPPEKRD